jgi:hypothetical protein
MPQQSAQIRLTGKEYKQLHEAIFGAFSYDDLKRCIRFELDESADRFVRRLVHYSDQIDDVIEWAESQDLVKDLLRGLRECNKRNVALQAVADALLKVDDLEKIVVSNPELFSDPDAWRQAMIRAEATVCRVENPEGRAWGSGFLVGPNLLMTNHHVKDKPHGDFEGSPGTVRFRFGFRKPAAGAAEGGKLYALETDAKPSWLIYESPTTQLDYAIVRLTGRPGEEGVGAFVGAPRRGWLAPAKLDLALGQALFILQHPLGDVLKMANGGLKERQGAWLEYEVNTEPGSSGSPVFDNQWRLVALHSRAGQTEVNKGVALGAILDNLPASVKSLLPGPAP